jgi:hypothetical protein
VVSRTLSPLVLYCVHQTTAFLHIDSSALCQVRIIMSSSRLGHNSYRQH